MSGKRKTRNLLLWIGGGLVVAFLALTLYLAIPPTLPPPPPLPNPNGYETLMEAGRMVTGYSDPSEMSEEQLRSFVEANTNAIALARTALQQESRVPIEFTEAYIGNHLSELANLKTVGVTLSAVGKLAELEQRPADAAAAYLDTVRIGISTTQGGVMIDGLVSLAVEAIGTRSLPGVIHQLDAAQCREAAGTLEKLDAQREPLEEILQRERDWSRQTYPGLHYRLAGLYLWKATKQSRDRTSQKRHAQQTRLRELTIQFAARAYELEKGSPPGNVNDLVPGYLQSVPKDPATGTNMVHVP